jgi:alcohol dehydrogenase class IV
MEARKNVSPEFVLGEGALQLVGRYAANLGARKVFLVTDPGVIAAGWTDRACASLQEMGISVFLFSQVSPNPRDTEVMLGARLYREEDCDAIVAVGGGSPMDCAKGIGIVASNGGNILQYEGVDRIPIPGPPLLCIPTTAGTAADVSQFAIVNDTSRKVKIAILSKATIPDVALIDPLTATTMPALLTAATGMDALVHAIEAYLSLASSPITDLHALEAIRLISANLKNAIDHPLDLRYRDPMMLGSLLAGLAFSNASLGLVHAMAHALGGWMDLPHGECNALLLAHVVRFNYAAAPQRYLRVSEAFGLPVQGLPSDAIQELLLDAIRSLRLSVGLTTGLRDYGVRREDLRDLAKFAYSDPCLATNPVSPTIEEIEAIYDHALAAEG